MRRIKCTTHCSKCGRHFNSTQAFDSHRRGKFNPKPGERARYCVAPEDAADRRGRDLFVELTTRGICDIIGGRKTNVTIWALARPREYRGPLDEARMAPPPVLPAPTPNGSRGGGSGKRRKSRRWGRRLEDVR